MVTIGDQIWMAENLRYLPSVVGPDKGSQTIPYYYVYGNNGTSVTDAKATTNYSTYGVLYNWTAALSACPSGWHLPNDVEWKQMENYLADNGYNYDGTTGGGNNKIAKSITSASGWTSSSAKGAIGNTDYPAYRNKSGFTALPGGYRGSEGKFWAIEGYCYWWNATENSATQAWSRYMGFDYPTVFSFYLDKDLGFSVRCVRD